MANPERGITCLKYSLFAYNFFCILLGTTLFGIACWAFADWDFKYFINTLAMQHFHNGTAVLITAAVLAVLTVFIGCFGAVAESPTALLIYGLTCFVAGIFELAGAAYVLDNGTIWSTATYWLKSRFYELIYQMNYSNRAYEVMRVLQEHVGCCGSYNSRDYINVNMPVPNECRSPVTGNVWRYGCHEVFSHYLSTRAGPLAGLAIALVVLQILAAISAFQMRRLLRKVNGRSSMYNRVPKSG